MAATPKAITRVLRREQDRCEDYEMAAQMRQHFHSAALLASSGLNVILEEDDAASSTWRRRGMIKTQTCCCLTALQKSTERTSTSSLSSQYETDEDDEWGYFSKPLAERPITPDVRDPPPTNFHQYAPRGKLGSQK